MNSTNIEISTSLFELENKRGKLKSTLRKVREAQKQFETYEKLLKNKEEELEEKACRISQSYDDLRKEKKTLEEKLIRFYNEAKTVEASKITLLEDQKRFKLEVEELRKREEKLSKHESVLVEFQKKTEENYKKSESLKHQVSLDFEAVRKAQEKINFENKLLNDQLKSLSHKRDEFEKTRIELENNKKFAEEEKSKYILDRQNIQILKEKLTEERNMLRDEIHEAENARKLYEDKCKELDSKPYASQPSDYGDLDNLIESLQNQITVYNNEISIRESLLIEKDLKMQDDLATLNRNFENQRIIEESLRSTKAALLEMSSEIIPDLEILHKSLSVVSAEINQKSANMNELHARLDRDIALLGEVKVLAAAHQEKLDKKLEEIQDKEEQLQHYSMTLEERQSNLSFASDPKMESTMMELEANLNILKEKQLEVDIESEENSKAAEYLKIAIIEIEETKAVLKNEKGKMKEKARNVELKNKYLNEKIKEIEMLRKDLDHRTDQLKDKERHISIDSIKQKDIYLNASLSS